MSITKYIICICEKQELKIPISSLRQLKYNQNSFIPKQWLENKLKEMQTKIVWRRLLISVALQVIRLQKNWSAEKKYFKMLVF